MYIHNCGKRRKEVSKRRNRKAKRKQQRWEGMGEERSVRKRR